MKILSEKKTKLVAEKYGWSSAFAEGFVEGESMRRSGKVLSMYTSVGIDEYARGFREGYFERQTASVKAAAAESAAARMPRTARLGQVDLSKESGKENLQGGARL